jgi:hypothetical protein
MRFNKMTNHALRRYVVFRVKAIEFLDLSAIRQGVQNSQFLPYTPVGRTGPDFADSLRTVLLSWMAIFIDKTKGGLNVIDLWKEVFPKHKAEIDQVWNDIKPSWEILRQFRNKAGFHADKPIEFFKARQEISLHYHTITAALVQFQQLFTMLLKAEATELLDLENVVDDLLGELEVNQSSVYDRNEFKRYLMFPNALNTP